MIGAMMAAGALGGVTHCAAMCGPLVLMQGASLSPRQSACGRIAAGVAAPYHVGRLTTYALLGAATGAAGSGLLRMMSAEAKLAAVALAALALLALSVAILGGPAAGSGLGQRFASIGRRLRGGGPLKGLLLGLAFGLVPCGLVYAALAVAAASADPVRGAVLMLSFGIGSLPGLVAIGTVGRSLVDPRLAPKLAPFAIVIAAAQIAFLAVRAWMAA